MHLVRLIYKSEISEEFDPEFIDVLVNKAQVKNIKSNITGLLSFNKTHFIQCLEGSRDAVNATYHRIQNDSRHTGLTLLYYQEIIERQFEQWSMAYLPQSALPLPLTLKYSGTPNNNPYDIPAESAYRLIMDLKQHFQEYNREP